METQLKTLIIGCGSSGCNAVDFIKVSDGFTHEMVAINIDPDKNKNLDIKISKIQKIKSVVIVCGLGESRSGDLTPDIINIMKKLNIMCSVIAILPFKFEGNKRNRIAQNQLEIIENSCDTLYTINEENRIQNRHRQKSSISLLELFNEVNEEALNLLSNHIVT